MVLRTGQGARGLIVFRLRREMFMRRKSLLSPFIPLPEIHHVSKNPADMGIIPATDVPASDEVIDAIADIEMLRQTTEKETGFAARCLVKRDG
jgi:hypothetical protein